MSQERTTLGKSSLVTKMATLGGTAVGAAVGRYAGVAFLIPIGFTLLIGAVLVKACPEKNKPILAASAVQAGQGLWMLLSAILLSLYGFILVDVALILVGALWLAYFPSMVLVILLIAYQVIGLAVNLQWFFAEPIGSLAHRALLVHVLFRLTAVTLMLVGILRLRRIDEAGRSPDTLIAEETFGMES